MIDKITFCLPSKSNLRYLKMAIPSIRKNASRPDHDIIVYVDEDTDGTVEWLEKNANQWDVTYIINPNLGSKLRGIGNAYDDCVRASKTDVFMIFHADMYLGKNADLNAYKHLTKGTVVCSTRIEPPLHPNNGEKILKGFGLYPEELLVDKLDEYIDEQQEVDKVTNGIFAPWMMYKEEFLSLGGHDPRMHSCREDSDVFNRMHLAGYKFVQPWNSLVYHLTGRGAGSFSEDKERHEKWKKAMNASTREFTRKWKSNVKHTALMEPIVAPIYDIGIRVTNCNLQLLGLLEPWCNDIHVDCDPRPYIEQEQPNTTDVLVAKIRPLEDLGENDVTLEIDGNNFNQHDFQIITEMGTILKQSGRIGRSKLGKFNIEVNIKALEEKQEDLIHITN